MDADKEGSISENVRKGIVGADRVVAVVDRANANVGFEVGYALGLGRSVALCVSQTSPQGHPWLSRAPLTDHNGSVRERSDLVSVARREDGWRVTPTAEAGAGVLLLCPAEETGNDIRAQLEREVPGLTLAEPPAALDAVDALLEGIGAVLWVVPKVPPPDGQRDPPGVATDAIVAGFALARQRKLHVLLPQGARLLANVARFTTRWTRVGELPALARTLIAPTPAKPRTWLEVYRAALEKQHARLIPVFASATASVVDHCYVEVCVADECPPCDGPSARGGRFAEPSPLGALLEAHPRDRFLISGEPDAGKSTMLRHLAWAWSTSDAPAEQPLPVFVSLSRLAESAGDPFELAAKEVARREGSEQPGLAAPITPHRNARGSPHAPEKAAHACRAAVFFPGSLSGNGTHSRGSGRRAISRAAISSRKERCMYRHGSACPSCRASRPLFRATPSSQPAASSTPAARTTASICSVDHQSSPVHCSARLTASNAAKSAAVAASAPASPLCWAPSSTSIARSYSVTRDGGSSWRRMTSVATRASMSGLVTTSRRLGRWSTLPAASAPFTRPSHCTSMSRCFSGVSGRISARRNGLSAPPGASVSIRAPACRVKTSRGQSGQSAPSARITRSASLARRSSATSSRPSSRKSTRPAPAWSRSMPGSRSAAAALASRRRRAARRNGSPPASTSALSEAKIGRNSSGACGSQSE